MKGIWKGSITGCQCVQEIVDAIVQVVVHVIVAPRELSVMVAECIAGKPVSHHRVLYSSSNL